MGRKRTKNKDMPSRVYFSRGFWFFVTPQNKWIKLGKDKAEALREYSYLLNDNARLKMSELIKRYQRDEMPKKSPATKQSQERRIKVLTDVFGEMAIDEITKSHIARYLDEYPKKVQANRDVALLSHIFTKGIRWQLCQENPCLGVERNKEVPRDRYVSHQEFLAVFECGSPVIQTMMALAYVSGQREGDLIKMLRDQITPEGIRFKQGKTKKRLLIEWSDGFRFAFGLAATLPDEGITSLYVVCRKNGQPYTLDGFQTLWQNHMKHCLGKGLIAERFTFHDLRAKSGSDAKDGRLLGHLDQRVFNRVYKRTPELVSPTS